MIIMRVAAKWRSVRRGPRGPTHLVGGLPAAGRGRDTGAGDARLPRPFANEPFARERLSSAYLCHTTPRTAHRAAVETPHDSARPTGPRGGGVPGGVQAARAPCR